MPVTVPKRELFINGQWVAPTGNKRLPVINPATEEEVGSIPAAVPADVDAAVAAAQACVASGAWTRSTGAYRAKFLHAIADKVGLRVAGSRDPAPGAMPGGGWSPKP